MTGEISQIEIVTLCVCVVEVITKYRDRIVAMTGEISEIEMQEKEEKEMQAAENKMNRATNLLDNPDEAKKNKRGWFQTHRERLKEKGAFE